MIKVASYNMRKSIGTDRRRQPERTLQVLCEVDADIIALQEADRRFGAREAVLTSHLLAEHGDWKPVMFGMRARSMGWHGNAMLVRRDAEILGCQAIHLPALEPRGAIMADIRIKGQTIRVVGMHLDLSGLWRRRQARAVIAHLEASSPRQATVLMGDLNDWSAQNGCLHDFAQHFTFAPTGKSFHARRPMARLDRIMVTPDLSIQACGVHESLQARTASDHLPIWAELQPA
ncbi:endonuclease/exonuclease/phosphatase family protein [Sphingomonas xinjiangensis]|uniref:Endonuclease/exonuclease/phosphatase family metal-dependent hydrolase n=1 Tax=Sphingomonas xinjiangensis TaxID=643568 RepID=A0A840YK21_9SPHN|nr:endonuclease/exonuclease/phosphatase family protein [Sphingomonas xinjiangensis]MBB5709250.1 endonuclease/exonuclease/phosphatase family metal-dependent hydrolase [Sphingomonas xinjiangensis]